MGNLSKIRDQRTKMPYFRENCYLWYALLILNMGLKLPDAICSKYFHILENVKEIFNDYSRHRREWVGRAI